MSYTQLVLSDRPLGYWAAAQISRSNLLSSNQYSIESSTSGWTALADSSISRVTSDSWSGTASLRLAASSTSTSGFQMSPGSRVQVSYGRTYTMVARIKNTSGSRSARVRVEYFTTQSGSTQVSSDTLGEEFIISSSEWTTIYHTEIIPVGSSSNYFASWGVVTGTGTSSDTLLVDGIQFFEGPLYSLYDEQYSNDATARYLNYQPTKPIIFGGENAVRLNKEAIIEITNSYKLFIEGTESNPACIDFWFSLEKSPSNRHQLLKAGPYINVYIENDKVYLDYLGTRDFIQVSDWSKQHYFNLVYSEKTLNMYVDGVSISIPLGQDFKFSPVIEGTTPSIIIGPASQPMNLCPNPSLEDGTTSWTALSSSISAITTDSFSGSRSIEVTKQASTNSGTESSLIPVSPYTTYSASAYVKFPTGNTPAAIRLVCEQSDLSGSVIDTVYSEITPTSNTWTRIKLQFTPTVESYNTKIRIIQPSQGTDSQKFLLDAVLLEQSSTASDWSEDTYDSDPLYISSIALYPNDIGQVSRSRRMLLATTDSPDLLAVEYKIDRFDLNYSKSNAVAEYNVLAIDNDSNIQLNNTVLSENIVTLSTLSSESVSYGTDGGTVTLNRLGIKFADAAYLNLTQAPKFFNPISSTVRLQTKFDTTSGDGVLLMIGGIIGGYALVLKKSSNKLKFVSVVDPDLPEETIFETTTLTNGLINVALSFENQKASAIVDDQEFLDLDIPFITGGGEIVVGNIPAETNGYPDYIRNFSIDSLTDFEEIDWIGLGNFTMRFNGNLNVSQKGIFTYTSATLPASNNTIFSINDAARNKVYINDTLSDGAGYIPNFDYDDGQQVSVRVELETDNSASDTKTFNNAYLSSYNSNDLLSSLSNFYLKNNESGGAVQAEPFIANIVPSNVLSHDNNLGIRFTKDSTGSRVVCNGSTYQALEMVIKINSHPNRSEEYTIFDISGATNTSLYFTDSGLSKVGTYVIYVDGNEVSNISDVSMSVGEVYHVVVVLPTPLDLDIHIGVDKNLANAMDGTLGRINMYTAIPTNMAELVSQKYQDLLGNITETINGGSVSITDTDSTQTFVRDSQGEYYEMKNLPKVKIVTT